jgi:hypothetical protein
MKRFQLTAIALVIIAVTLVATTSALLSSQKVIPNQGNIRTSVGIEVYTNPQTTTLCTEIDWGTLNEGVSITKTVYVKSTANNTQTLHMATSDWTPTNAASLITLSWNRENAAILPGEILVATLTLTTAADMANVDAFSFNLIIESLA